MAITIVERFRLHACRIATLAAAILATILILLAPMGSRPLEMPPAVHVDTPLEQLRSGSYNIERQARGAVGKYGWRFKSYLPSQLEEEWKTAVKTVEHLKSYNSIYPIFEARFQQLVAETAQVAYSQIKVRTAEVSKSNRERCSSCRKQRNGEGNQGSADECASIRKPLNASIWSRMVYEFVCLEPPCGSEPQSGAPKPGATHTSYIEPLVGMLRHPRNSLSEKERRPQDVDNKDYMIVDEWALNNLGERWSRQPTGSKYFDLGSSTYTQGPGGPSQSWFVDLAEDMCVPVGDSWLWEAKPHDPVSALGIVPGNLKPGYHWFNVPLSAEEGSWDNPLNHLLAKVEYGDPVLLKVDFDTPSIEDDIVHLIRDTDEIAKRVDELFFEHHVVLFWMSDIWKPTVNWKLKATDSIQLFQDLRAKGIRAHSWV